MVGSAKQGKYVVSITCAVSFAEHAPLTSTISRKHIRGRIDGLSRKKNLLNAQHSTKYFSWLVDKPTAGGRHQVTMKIALDKTRFLLFLSFFKQLSKEFLLRHNAPLKEKFICLVYRLNARRRCISVHL